MTVLRRQFYAPIGVSNVQKAGVELRRGTQGFALGLQQNPLTSDNLEKVQADRLAFPGYPSLTCPITIYPKLP